MSHMVIYRSADGKPKYQQVDDLHAAVSYVEKLRNEEGLEGSKIFRLEQVNFRFEPYYQVKVEVAEPASSPAVPPPPPVTAAPASVADTAAAPPPEAPVTSSPVVDLTTSSASPTSSLSPAPPASPASPTASSAPATGSAPAVASEPAGEPVGTADEPNETNGVRRGLFGR